jgi:ABC-type bacteriocin/lantibiotic exporter with double-glycine peptidase domain
MPALRADVLTVSLVMHFLALALPLALLQIYDRILPAQAYGTAVFLVIGVGIAIILEAILRYGRMAMFARLGARYEADATMRAFDRLLKVDLAEVEKRGTAAVVDDLRAISQVRDFWSGQAGAALYEAPFVIVYLALIAYVGGWLVVIPMLLFVAAIAVAMLWTRGIEQAALAVEQEGRQRRDFLWTAFAALEDIKSAGAEGPVGAYYRHSNDRYLARSAELETRLGWIRENATAFGQLATVLIVAFGAVSVVAGDLTTGALAACTMLAGRSIGPAMASLGYWSQLARIGEAQDRVDDLLGMPLNPGLADDSARSAEAPRVTRGEISIEAPGLLDGKVGIQPGEVVHLATVDTPKASKLLSVISGMTHDPSITVRVDGRAVGDYGRDGYREAVVLVTRQLALVPGSILDNLTLFDPRYNAGARDYCEKLGLQPYLDRLRHGILTEVGPGTAEHLDEGLAQRIALIRALLRKPKILLLDHAASGIDLDGVKRLAELLRSLQGGTTVLVSTYKEALIEATTRQLVVGGKGA